MSSDLPTDFNKVDLIPIENGPSTSLQIMKRLNQSASSSDSDNSRAESPGFSPANSPQRRQFKRRRRSSPPSCSSYGLIFSLAFLQGERYKVQAGGVYKV